MANLLFFSLLYNDLGVKPAVERKTHLDIEWLTRSCFSHLPFSTDLFSGIIHADCGMRDSHQQLVN